MAKWTIFSSLNMAFYSAFHALSNKKELSFSSSKMVELCGSTFFQRLLQRLLKSIQMTFIGPYPANIITQIVVTTIILFDCRILLCTMSIIKNENVSLLSIFRSLSRCFFISGSSAPKFNSENTKSPSSF